MSPKRFVDVATVVCALVLLASGCITNQRRLLLDELSALGYEAEETERGIVVFLPDVLFAFDRAELTETGRRKVDGVAELVERLATYDHLAIEGNTDSVGPEVYNQWLSEERAISAAPAMSGRSLLVWYSISWNAMRYPPANGSTSASIPSLDRSLALLAVAFASAVTFSRSSKLIVVCTSVL